MMHVRCWYELQKVISWEEWERGCSAWGEVTWNWSHPPSEKSITFLVRIERVWKGGVLEEIHSDTRSSKDLHFHPHTWSKPDFEGPAFSVTRNRYHPPSGNRKA
ncbi:rho-related GTP-binding protein RhoH isoform X2 [Notamacropus eugenii]|uniref:rho-related GTP-binding protein RhoH isoform X2 n=1 Tax=Notamacropus eugenii TaxID=9315 RepID=UPI003B674E08